MSGSATLTRLPYAACVLVLCISSSTVLSYEPKRTTISAVPRHAASEDRRSATFADDRLIVWANRGDLILTETARRSPDKYRQLAAKTGLFRTDAWPHVVLAGGLLYCKDRDGNLICLRL